MEPPPPPPPPQPNPAANPKPPKTRRNPQAIISKFWSKYNTRTPGKITSIFPRSLYESLLPNPNSSSPRARNAAQSYQEARTECCALVRAAVAECERSNEKFSDPDFDIENDFSAYLDNCLHGLVRYCPLDESGADKQKVSPWEVKWSLETLKDSGVLGNNGSLEVDVACLQKYVGEDDDDDVCSCPRRPGSVHRVDWIFESPQFTVDGYSSSDIKQGSNGACWWLAAVATIAHRKDLMEKICVARDEECGVYGFVFYRDGEWISTIVDDNLYLTNKDFGYESDIYDATGKKARLHKKQKQSGSEALFFAKCEDTNETWLPLLEKAFSKVHGDYQSINGGSVGAGLEDLTGGVTTIVAGNKVLRKDRLWRELVSSGGEDGEFVFGLSASNHGGDQRKNGLALGHAYSILQAREVENEDGKKFRLVKIRNPWGQRSDKGLGEWHGPWSDGSREWTPYMIKKLRHEFGDDGVFWMSYEDVLMTFRWLYRTRLFDERWTVVQQWTSVRVSWVTGYLKKKFIVEVKEAGLVVIVLSQLDDRYFVGLEGQYVFTLNFLLQSAGSSTPICQVHPIHSWDRRCINCELHLEPGTYEVIPKITAERRDWTKPVEQVVKNWADKNPQKLRQVGLQYDLAHAKGGVLDEDEELQKKRAREKKKEKKENAKVQKMRQMEDAMRRMELAMMQMRAEFEREVEDHNNRNRDKRSEVRDGREERAQPDISPPGCWPDDPAATDSEAAVSCGDNRTESVANTKDDTRDQVNTDHKDGAASSQDVSQKETTSERPDTRQVVVKEKKPPRPPTPATPEPGPRGDSDSDSDTDSDNDSDSSLSSASSCSSTRTRKKQRWNAVCVLGLRVYAQHANIKVRLGEQDTKEQGLCLVTSEGKPVGPTS